MASSSKEAAFLLLLAVVGTYANFMKSDVRTATEAPCPQCSDNSPPPGSILPPEMHMIRLNAIKTQLLSKLRLQQRPNVSLDVPRQVLLDTVRRSGHAREAHQVDEAPVDLQPEEVFPVTSEIITFAAPGEQFNNHTLLEFTHSDADRDGMQVTEAVLWVFVRGAHGRLTAPHLHGHHRTVNGSRHVRSVLWVFWVLSDLPDAVHNPDYLVASLHMSERGWQRLDVTSAVQRWFAHPEQPMKLLVDCSSCSGHLEAVLFNNYKFKGAHKPDSRGLDASYRPFLVIRTKPSPTRRLARRALQCDKNTKHCCKEEFYVSFRELMWDDWILAPSGYHANYCRGSCESLYQTPDSFHSMYAHVVEETRRVREPYSISQCCAPTRFSAMTLIYLDQHKNIIKRDVPRMVVEECGCV